MWYARCRVNGQYPPHLPQVLVLLRWLLIATFIVMGYVVLSYLAGVLGPILAALGIAYLLNPVLDLIANAPIGPDDALSVSCR